MAVVEEYWSGVLSRLQAEVDVLNGLVAHAAERGTQNELSLARLLQNLVPRRFGIGSGLLIDAQDNYSKQLDIVVSDVADEPALLAQTNQVLFPVEAVLACIEVKTRLNVNEVRDGGAKHASVRALKSTLPTGAFKRPLFALVGYNSEVHPTTVAKQLRDLPADERPDLAIVINQGLLAGRPDILGPDLVSGPVDDDYFVGVTALHERAGGVRNAGKYLLPDPKFVDPEILVDGSIYLAVPVNAKGYVLADSSRALLLFCEVLLRFLAQADGRPSTTLTRYLTGPVLDIIELKAPDQTGS